MHQITLPIKFAVRGCVLVQKRTLEDGDLQIVADLVCDGLREGFYAELLPGKKRSDVVRFLRRLVTRCEIRHYDRFTKRLGRRAAALFVYTVEGEVVGFGVLGQVLSRSIKSGFYFTDEAYGHGGTDADHVAVIPGHRIHSNARRTDEFRLQNLASREDDETWIKNGVELLMLGVAPLQRGFGYGAAILDSLIQGVSRQYFNFVARCPSENQLLFAMLITRGFVAVGRYSQGRILRFAFQQGTVRPGGVQNAHAIPCKCAVDQQSNQETKKRYDDTIDA